MATELQTPKYRNRRAPGPAPGGGQRIYDSVKEARYATELELRRKAGDILDWQAQVRIPLEGPDGAPLLAFESNRPVIYIADFVVTLGDGRREIHEVKGYSSRKDPVTRLWRLKLGLVIAMWPDTAVVIV